MAVINTRLAALSSPARNRTNAAWLRQQLAELRDELRRAEAPALSNPEIVQRLMSMLEGREPTQ